MFVQKIIQKRKVSMRIKNRILKKHNNTNAGKHAPSYAKGLKVYKFGYYPTISEYGDKDKTKWTWFMTYSSKPFINNSRVYYNQVARMKRTAHPTLEFVTGEITEY